MRAVETLMQEHRVIERGLAVLERMGRKLAAGEHIPADRVEGLLDFFRDFADGCHHAKEEGSLFPALEARGVPRAGGPVGVMLAEHEEGRSYQRRLRQELGRLGADAGAGARFAEIAAGYANLLRQHILKEDQVLFRMADQVLTPADDRRLVEAFERHEQEVMGPLVHERFHRLIEDLERELGVGMSRG
jgi:hemerythrin-like domain-containing protein